MTDILDTPVDIATDQDAEKEITAPPPIPSGKELGEYIPE